MLPNLEPGAATGSLVPLRFFLANWDKWGFRTPDPVLQKHATLGTPWVGFVRQSHLSLDQHGSLIISFLDV